MEERLLLTAITWNGAGDGATWADPANWAGNQVPGAGDDAIINAPGSPTIIASGSITVHSVTSSDPLEISSGSFVVTAGTSELSDGLTVASGAALSVQGAGSNLTASGATVIDGASLYAQTGGTLSLPDATGFNGPVDNLATLQASGSGSVLSLDGLTSLAGDTTNFFSSVQVQALSGGQLGLPNLTQVSGGSVRFESDGGSTLDLSSLATVQSNAAQASLTSFQVTNGASLLLGSSLASLNNVNLTLDGTGTFPVGQFTSLTDGTVTITGGNLAFGDLADVDGDNFEISGGADVSMPSVTSFASAVGSPATIQVQGSGSQLSLPGLTTIDEDATNFFSQVEVLALAGGAIDAPALASVSGGPANLVSDGSGSLLNVAALTSMQGNLGQADVSSLQATNGGTLSIGSGLTTLNGVNLTLDGTDLVPVNQFTSITNGTVTISGGSFAFGNLSNINGDSFQVSGGAGVALPLVTSFAGSVGEPTAFQVQGSGSQLSLPGLTTVSEDTSNFFSRIQFLALAGGAISAPALTTIGNGPVNLVSDGSGSSLDIAALSSMQGHLGQGDVSSLQATNGGAVLINSGLASLDSVNVTLDGTGTLSADQFTSITNGTVTISGGSFAFGNLTNINGDSFQVSGGASVALPSVTSFASAVGEPSTLQAQGSGSQLSLPGLTTINEDTTNFFSRVQLLALAGGVVSAPALATISGGPVVMESDGSGSLLNLAALATLQANVGQGALSSFQATDGGAVSINAALTSLDNVNLTLDGTGTLPINQFASITNGTLTVTGGSLNLVDLDDINGDNILVSGGANVALPSVTGFASAVGSPATLQAQGSGSQLSLPNLTAIAEDSTNFFSRIQVSALAGGAISAPALTTISGGPVMLESDGSGSSMNLAALADFQASAGQGSRSSLQVTNGGALNVADLKNMTDVNVTTDPTASFTLTSFQSFSATSGATVTVSSSALIDQGSLSVPDNATVDIEGELSVNGSASLSLTPAATLQVQGNLLGTTVNADDFSPQGTVVLTSNTGTTQAPQLIEAMSADLGAVQAGFTQNFAYGTLSLAANTYAQLVDQSKNSTGTGAEALYANELIVPAGATLDLNGLNLYVRGAQIAGTVLNGTVTQVAAGGPIQFGTPTLSEVMPAGQVDNWTFFGRAGHEVTVVLNPGSFATPAPPGPQLNYGEVELLDANNDVLASGISTGYGGVVTLAGVSLPADGTYTLQVQAPASQSDSTGNYYLSVYDVTPNVNPLTVNQPYTSTIQNSYSVDQWTFSESAGQQVQLNVANTSNGSIEFDLTGPGGYTAFTNLQSNSGLITLPSTGNYVLTAHSTGSQGGSYGFELEQTSVVDLSLGSTYDGTLAGSGQAQLFAVTVPVNQSLSIDLTDSTSSDVNELYAKLGSPPTPGNYDYRYANLASADQQILVPAATAGTWYILVYSDSVPTPSSFTLQAVGAQIRLTSVTPTQSAAGSPATLVLSGSGFDNATTVSLVAADGTTVYPAGSVSLDTFQQITATVDLTSVPQGTYSVEVANPGGVTDAMAGVFTVTAPGQAHFEDQLILPATIGFHIASTFYVEYSNTGSVAMPAPLLLLQSAQPENQPLMTLDPALQVSGFWTSATPQGYSNTIQILASGKVPGVLEPGETVTVPVYYAGMQQPYARDTPNFDFQLIEYSPTQTGTLNWSSVESSLQPANVGTAAWDAIFGNFIAQAGDTWAGYTQLLDNEAAYLGHLGENVTNVGQLISFAVLQANGILPNPQLAAATDITVSTPGAVSLDFSRAAMESIDSRYQLGSLGYGWTDNWQYSLNTESDGTVVVTMPSGAQRVFQPDSRGSDYFDQPGDYGTLRAGANGTFTLTESNGNVEAFNADGTLDYIQDTNGNRVTAGYSSGQLSSLTSTSGASLTIGYNSSGLIGSVTSSDGRTITYSYTDDSLTSVQSYDGEITQYAYDDGTNPATTHALTEIMNPDGAQQNFAYNGAGQLTETYQNGGANPLYFSYDLGQVTVTDASGDVTQYFYDAQGQLIKTVDPLGNYTFNAYDANFNLTSVTGPTGLTQSYGYDANGNVISATNPLGQTTSYTYTGADNLLSTLTDAQGDVTSYQYNSQGDQIAIQAPDHTVQSATYNAEGDPLSLINANGQATQYQYNAQGLAISETLADGSQTTFTYDSHGNLTAAVNASGTITLSYDAGDRLTEVVYPNGQFLQYTYNAAGQRIQMVDQSGYTVDYSYNAIDQLASLTDGSGNPIVSYTYNGTGLLSRQDLGNGTYTTYQYDAAGNLLHLVNYAPDGSVDSRFDYTYDALGNQTSMATLDGTWTYSYDAIGELVHASFASVNPDIPSQDLSYVYNAAGDRVQTIVNGVTSSYTSNSTNEYTTVTSSDGTTASYTYDAAGNLISMTNASGTTTYTYDSLNRLISVTSPSDSWIYQYDALSNLSATTHNGQTTQNLIDPAGLDTVVGQYTGSGALISDYTYGLGLVSQAAPSGTNYYQFDGIGSTVALTNSVGGIVNTYSYAPSGNTLQVTGSAANPFTFIGQSGVSGDGSGLLNMRARSYDPTTGQFTSNDPSGLLGGQTNLRVYAGSNPINGIDPTGQFTAVVAGLGIGALGGAFDYLYGWAMNNLPGNVAAGSDPSFSIKDATVSTLAGGVGGTIGQSYLGAAAQAPVAGPGAAAVPYIHQTMAAIYSFLPGAVADSVKNRAAGKPIDPALTAKLQLSAALGLGFFILFPPTAIAPILATLATTVITRTAISHDPNAMIGPTGYGSQNFVAGSALLPYQIDFENAPTATAPAQQVVITDQIDPSLDLNTFQLGSIGFGDTVIAVPAGSQSFQAVVPMTYNGESFDVDVAASLNFITRTVTWRFESIDPNTALPPDVLAGFLPPEDGTGRGEGYVNYTIQPLPGLATGTQLHNVASITFDANPPITTDQVNDDDPTQGVDPTKQALNTIDSGAPTSSVAPLPATITGTSFTVSWSGQDDVGGSGVAAYNIWVSVNGGAYTEWQTDTTSTSAVYSGLPGSNTYAFYSQAIDNVGNVEPAHATADTQTILSSPLPPTPPAPSLAAASDSGPSDTDGVTDDNMPTFIGTGTPGDEIEIFANGNLVGQGAIAGDGSYAALVDMVMADGTYSITDDQVDMYGEHSDMSIAMTPNLVINTVAPTVAIGPVSPNPTSTPVDQMTITFSEPVYDFTLASLQLSLDGGANLLTSAQTLTSSDNMTWTLGGLTGLTGTAGTYILSLSPTGIEDLAGNAPAAGAMSSFTFNSATTAATTTTLQSSVHPAAFGQLVTFTATVNVTAPGSGTPTGNVSFYDGSTLLGTGALSLVDGQDVATLSTDDLTIGQNLVTAVYEGDTNFAGSASAIRHERVWRVATTATVDSSTATSPYGQPVTFTAVVVASANAGAPPTGNVVFKDGTTTVGTGALSLVDGQYVATLTTSKMAVGDHTITAVYAGDSNYYKATSAAISETIETADTATAILLATDPIVVGQNVKLTATVSSGGATPTGSVTFMNGTTPLGTVNLGGGQAVLNVATLPVGSDALTAVYTPADDSFATSSSSAVSETVDQASTRVSVASSVTPAAFGQSITFTATVKVMAPGDGTPTGNVTFYDGGTLLGTGTLSVVGNDDIATFATAGLSVGLHAITAVYGGDTNFVGDTSSGLNQRISAVPTAVSVATSAASSQYGLAVTFTATVVPNADAGAAPSGNVTFKDGTTNLGNGTLSLVGGQYVATLTTSKLAFGNHSITAVYVGDDNYQSSTSAAISETILSADTSTVLSVAKDPVVVGQTVKLTANVASAGATPTGSVTFMDGATVLGTANLGGGQAVLNVATLPVGSDSLTAVYTPADSSFATSGSSAVSETVNQAATRVTVASDGSPAVYGALVTFTATVNVTGQGAGTPTGTVSFYDGGTLLGTGTLSVIDGDDVATFATSSLGVGVHAITAVYGGDANFLGDTSNNLNQRVALIVTTISVVSNTSSSEYGQSVTFTATIVLSAYAGVAPTGKVNFKDGTKLLGSSAVTLVDGEYTATVTTIKLAVGDDAITAIYVGDSIYESSTSTAIDQVVS